MKIGGNKRLFSSEIFKIQYLFLLGIIIIFLICVIAIIIKKCSNLAKRKKLVSENKYLIENRERISKQVDAHSDNLKSARNKVIIFIILIILYVILSAYSFKNILITWGTVVVLLLIFGKSIVKYITENNDKYDEFNNLFRACTDNEMIAYKILTPDIMEEFVNIKKNTYGNIDIRVIYGNLYIRFLSGGTFDSTLFNKKQEKEKMFQSLVVLEEVMHTMEKVKKIIDSKSAY